jgi:hypothetical protein
MRGCRFTPDEELLGGLKAHTIMKYILLLLAAGALAMTGCAPIHRVQGEPSGGVDHGEHPGDLEHGATMQQ